MNPYDPPIAEASAVDDSQKPKFKTNLLSLLLPAFIGAVIGSFVLAPIARSPADPTGHVFPAVLGGLISLFAAIIFRAIKRSNRTVSSSDTPI